MSSYTPHVRRVVCDDVTISRALLLYKIAFILLGSGQNSIKIVKHVILQHLK